MIGNWRIVMTEFGISLNYGVSIKLTISKRSSETSCAISGTLHCLISSLSLKGKFNVISWYRITPRAQISNLYFSTGSTDSPLIYLKHEYASVKKPLAVSWCVIMFFNKFLDDPKSAIFIISFPYTFPTKIFSGLKSLWTMQFIWQ